MSNTKILALLGLVALAVFLSSEMLENENAKKPVPEPCPGPGPCPVPNPNPRPKPKPWDELATPAVAGLGKFEAKVGGRVSPDGAREIHCDLPGDLHLKNVGGSDGAGLCVFTSLAHSARWQNIPVLEDFRDWMRKYPGGGYPEKVDRMIAKCCQERSQPVPEYIQIEGQDLEVLKLACRTGRMPGVTYSRSPTGRYGGGTIAHMVSLPHADDEWFCVLDNNYPGDSNYEWMTPEEFKKTYAGGGSGWSVIFLNPSPPPYPRNPR